MSRITGFAVAFMLLACPSALLADDMSTMDMGGSPSDRAFAAATHGMMKSMDLKPTGRPDADFVTMMIPHHQGAIDMAKVELQYGKDPKLRELASGIVAAQEKEIAEMKAWLAQHAK